MKQLILLQYHDIIRLKSGQSIELVVGGGQIITLGYDRTREPRNSNHRNRVEVHVCKKCKKEFDSIQGVTLHNQRVHTKITLVKNEKKHA